MTADVDLNLTQTDFSAYCRALACAIVLTHDGKILLQQRPADGLHDVPYIGLFGGGHEDGETLPQALCRELNEELGAVLVPSEAELLFADVSQHKGQQLEQLITVFFWHDVNNTISGCYEHAPITFDSAHDALADTRLSASPRRGLEECLRRGLIS